MTPELRKAFLTASLLAYSHRSQLSESDLEQVLIALVDVLPDQAATEASEALFHLREARKAQMTLDHLLEEGKSK